MTLGSFIKEKRIAAGMSHTELGKKLGFLAWTVGQIESDAWEPNWELACKIAKLLGFSPRAYGDLIDRERPFRDVGAYLVAKRRAARKTRAEVARVLEIEVSHLTNYERGAMTPNWRPTKKLAVFLSFDPNDVARLVARHVIPYREMRRHTVSVPIPLRSAAPAP